MAFWQPLDVGKSPTITFLYKNYRGKVAQRIVSNPSLVYEHSIYHGTCWMIRGLDVHKQEIRDFKILDIIETKGNTSEYV